MKEALLLLLLSKFAGVRKDGLAQLAGSLALTVTTEEEAQALVGKITDSQVTEFVTDWRKEADAENSRAIETFRKKTPVNPEPPKNEPTPANPTDPTDIATIIKNAVSEHMKPLQEKLSNYEANSIIQNRKTLLEDKLKTAPDTFKSKTLNDFGRMNFKDDEDFTAYLTETETGLQTYNQEISNQGLSRLGKPYQAAGTPPENVSTGVTAYLEANKEGGSGNLGGKEV